MTAVGQVLDRLHAAARAPIGTGLDIPQRVDKVLAPLMEHVTAMEAAAPTSARPSHSALDDARKAWANSGGAVDVLTTRQIRALCWEPDYAMDPAFIGALANHPDLTRNRRWIEGLIDSYLARWRTMPQPDIAEHTLRRAVLGFRGRGDRIAMYRDVATKLFSGGAPHWLAEAIVFDRLPVDETLDAWRINQASGLAEATADAAVAEWTRRFADKKRNLVGSAAHAWFRQLTEQLFSSSLVGPKALAGAMSALINWEQAEGDERIHQDLRTYLLHDPRFGDPRLDNRPIWDLCDAAARQRAIGWLAKDDLIFFFRFVIRNDPHGRRDFWLRYIENAVDAYVALSDEDAYRLRAQVKDRPNHARVLNGNTSAFLMRFRSRGGDILCIEFSMSGNALYIHDAEQFVTRHKGIRAARYRLSAQLKDAATTVQRVSHMSNWQWNTQNLLARYGVRPA